MNAKTIGIILGGIVIIGIGAFALNTSQPSSSDQLMMKKDSPLDSPEATIVEENNSQTNDSMTTNERYVVFSQPAFAAAKSKKRVLFFHAAWCPICKAANAAFTANPNAIPDGVVLFKTDYDTYGDLKKKYGITYQHTFVQVDENGNQIAKWNGGDLDALRTNIK